MEANEIICRPTKDTFVRFCIVLAAFFGFGLYFFYDGAVGYRQANEVYFSYHTFARLGELAQKATPAEWQRQVAEAPLLRDTVQTDNGPAIRGEKDNYPLPRDCKAAQECPPEAQDAAAMRAGWNDCWTAYTGRMHYPVRAGEHPYNEGAIREQWIAGGACMAVSLLILWLIFRTKGRVLALRGDTVTAAGQDFKVGDITRLDLRQWWGKGSKGAAYATVNGRRIKMDGMTYGGFGEGAPADVFMKALLGQYHGEVLEYKQEDEQK